MKNDHPPHGLREALSARATKLWADFLILLQWSVFATPLLLIFVGSIPVLQYYPSVSPTPFTYAAMGFGALVSLLLFPPLSRNLPKWLKQTAYWLFLPAGLLIVSASAGLEEQYAATPDGKQAREQALQEQQRQNEIQNVLAKAEAVTGMMEAQEKRFQSCLNWSSALPSLQDPVKESMQNPRSFEHVETSLILPDGDGRNVAMKFRAENGFGAIRTAVVKATFHADDCSVSDIGEPITD